jgi:hypothetical protein
MIVLILVGITLFFPPLNGVHRQMLEERKKQRAAINRHLVNMFEKLEGMVLREGDPARNTLESFVATGPIINVIV